MKKNKNNELKFDSSIPLKKMDDWSRRTFIKRLGLFMGAFGVPFLTRIETMSRISKKIFGNSYAFAQGGERRFLISLRFRSGYFMNALFPLKRDSEVSTVNRNFHAGNQTVIAADSGGGRFLYLSPQMAPLAGLDRAQATTDPPVLAPNSVSTTNYADRIVFAQARNGSGHTNMFQSSTINGSPDFTAAHAAQQDAIAEPLLPMSIVLGSRNSTDYSQLGGLSGKYSPLYAQSVDEITGMFQNYTMTPPSGQAVDQAVTDKVMEAVALADDSFLTVMEQQGRQGIEALRSSVAKLRSLLSSGLAATLTPTQAHIDAILGTGDSAVPNPQSNMNTVLGNDAQALADFFIFAGLCAANGVASSFGLTINTSDHHGNRVQPGGAAGTPGGPVSLSATEANNGTLQASHAATLGQLFTNVLRAFDSNPLFIDASTGNQIGAGLAITGESEFGRGSATNNGSPTEAGNDNPDGGCDAIFIIAPPGKVNGGTFGNRNDNDDPRYTGFDPDTGAETGSTNLLERGYTYGTLAKAVGVDTEAAGVRNVNYIKAAIDES